MLGAVNLGLTVLAIISSYNASARNATFFDDPRLRVHARKCTEVRCLARPPERVVPLVRPISLWDKWISLIKSIDSAAALDWTTGALTRLISETGNAARMRKAVERLWAFMADGSSVAYVSERHRFYDSISRR
jgi:hypothetical protein